LKELNKIILIFLAATLFVFSSFIIPATVLAGVEITSPAEGETVGGVTPIVVSYWGTPMYPVYFVFTSVTGGYWIFPPVLFGSHTFYWDTSGTPNGTQKTIQAYANWAGSPSGAYDTVIVTVNNPPPVITITSPTDGQIVSPEISILPVSVEYHNVQPNYHGIKWISLMIDGRQVGGLYVPGYPTSGTYTWNVNIAGYSLGEHLLQAYCTDTSDKWTYSDEVKIIRGIPPPSVEPTKQIPQDKVTTVAEPINVANGNMFTSQQDILIQGRGLTLGLIRTYNSQSDYDGQFGYGWRSNFDITLSKQPDQSVIEVDEEGVYTVYTKNPDGTYKPSAGKYSVLTKNPDDTYTILRKHGEKLYFDNQGRLIKIEDRNGNIISILRTSNGIITEVSDSSGRKLSFSADAQGKITQIEDPAGRIFKYEYDSNGNLIKTIGPLNNQTLYHYDTNYNLICQTDANVHSTYFEYDGKDRAYHSWQDENNNEVTLSFDTTNKITTSTDSLGNITKYEYNDYGLVTKITDSQNNIQTFSWDEALNKTSFTNQNGNTTSFTYDAKGNLLTIKDPLNNTTTFTYEPNFDFVNSITDALGNITEYLYDAKGNLIQVKDALTNTTDYTYDIFGQLVQIKDANNNMTNFNYDSYGNLIRIIDSQNNSTDFTYDLLGNITRLTDSEGNSTDFTYDLLNRLVRIAYSNDSKTFYAYDSVGNLISFVDPNNNITAYAYDVVNRLIKITDSLGNTTQYTYDTEGNRTAIIMDPNSSTIQYHYNNLNRLIKIIDPLNNQTNFSYEPVGNLILRTDANGYAITYTYDALNRLIKKQYPDQTEETFTYDAIGNILTATNPNISYSFTYSPLSQMTKVTDSNDQSLTYEYDPIGNRVKMTTPEGKTISYSYDSLNRITSIIDIYGNSTTYTYDTLGRRINSVLPNKTVTSYNYDSVSNLINLVNKTQDGSAITSYTYQYDNAGNRLVKLEPNIKTSYTYDALYRLTQVLDTKLKDKGKEKEHSSELYTYDALGNRLASLKDTYTYNLANQLLSAKNYTYEYDKNGNLIKKIEIDDDGQLKTSTFTYDYENRLTQVFIQEEDETKIVTFAYDPFGRRIKKTVQEQGETAEKESTTITYVYDHEDIILEYSTKQEDGEAKEEITRYIHGPGIDEPISIEQNNKIYYYHYDGLGSVTVLTDQNGKVIEIYSYDSFGNLKRQGNKVKNPFTYTAREFDTETGLYYYRTRYYDPALGRFLQTDPIGYVGGINLYTYVDNNPINWADPFGLDKQKKDEWWRWGPENWLWQIIYGQNEIIPMPGESWESYHQRFLQDFGKQMAISDIVGLWGLKSLVTTGGMYGVTKGGEILTSRVAQRTLTTVGGRGFMYVRGLRQTMYLRQASSGFMAAGKVSGVITVGATAYSGGLRLREWIYWKIATSVYNQ